MFLKFIPKSKGPRIAKISPKNNMVRALVLQENKIKATVTEKEWNWPREKWWDR